MSAVEIYNREIGGTFAKGHSSNQKIAKIVRDSERRFATVTIRWKNRKIHRQYLPLDQTYIDQKKTESWNG